MTRTVLILGASGKIGRHSARAFGEAGWQVRLYDRARGDMRAQAAGADVIVNGLNPPNYHNWAGIIPEITAQVIDTASATGATVIVPGNVYNFGSEPGVWDETTPHRPCSRKGRIREEMERAYRRSGVRTIILRAGNFLDPDRNGDVMSLVLLRGIAKGRLTYPGNPGAMQAYAYLPDWARAAAMLAEKRSEMSAFEDVPLGGLSFTADELRAVLQQRLGRPVRISGFPWWAMGLAAPIWELARELLEMRYLWNTDHALSDEKLRRLLPDFRPTDRATAMLAGLPGDIHPDQPVPALPRVAAS